MNNYLNKSKTLAEALSAGVLCVALNDDPSEMRVKIIAQMPAVAALSAAFEIPARRIALIIKHIRKNSAR